MNQPDRRPIGWMVLFAGAFGFVEAAVVVYLRVLYYPEGFSPPFKTFVPSLLGVELVREGATLVMLGAVAMLAGRSRGGRVGAFLLAFGVWDISFYLWLKAILGWPTTLFDWDILFLFPLPWIGPVIAPVLVACEMSVTGTWLMLCEERGEPVHFDILSVLAAVTGACVVLSSFMYDTEATLRGAFPRPYPFWVYSSGLALTAAGLLRLILRNRWKR